MSAHEAGQDRATLMSALQAAFPHGDIGRLVELLDLYGVEPYEREKERVQLAIVALSQGNEEKLCYFIQVAKNDYRDVLSWVETGELSAQQGIQAKQAVSDLLKFWGRGG
jgi:hypothetical protein